MWLQRNRSCRCRAGKDEPDRRAESRSARRPPGCAMNVAIVVSVVIEGVLTGLVYGLMALGLSVIFGIVRVVNFAHGEFAVIAMYAAYLLFRDFGLDPLVAMLPVAAVFFGVGYLLQSVLINPFVGRAEH